jgi:hypothetical protein
MLRAWLLSRVFPRPTKGEERQCRHTLKSLAQYFKRLALRQQHQDGAERLDEQRVLMRREQFQTKRRKRCVSIASAFALLYQYSK